MKPGVDAVSNSASTPASTGAQESAGAVVAELKALGTPERAKGSAWFFKTGKGGYGHGDLFFGVSVPQQRKVGKRFAGLPLQEIRKLLHQKVHECRLTGLFILVGQYKRGDAKQRERIARFYLRNLRYVNNWDLVDSSAPHILGHYLLDKPKALLYKFARSRNLWERRIAIIATQTLIRENHFSDCLAISELLLADDNDLIHKAAGWMLREVGDRSHSTEVRFLKKHAAAMPRTMLRYAIEKFPEKERKAFLALRKNK